MPLDVIMPALGMAQDSGVIVAWHKRPGDEVAEGDVLFEVETDKATMEVEAAGAGFLADVTAAEGQDVPVGEVIARIADVAGAVPAPSVEDVEPAPPGAPEEPQIQETPEEPDAPGAVPDGHRVIMPVLGMAQDSGLLVVWLVEPGAKVAADDPLFEVETDKSTMEVPAGADGYLAALLAEPGDEVPTGETIAILTEAPVAEPMRRGAAAAPVPAVHADAPAAPEPAPEPAAAIAKSADAEFPRPRAAPVVDGRILASPKARRLALEAGIDLAVIARSGTRPPIHAADVEGFLTRRGSGGATRVLTAEVSSDTFDAFAAWAATEAGLTDPAALLAGFAAAALGRETAIVAVERGPTIASYAVTGRALSEVTRTDAAVPDLILRDVRDLGLAQVALGAAAHPVISLGTSGGRIVLTLECADPAMTAPDCLHLLSELAGRLREPLRHLL